MQIVHNTNKQRSAYEQEYLTWYKGEGLSHAHAKSFANRKALEATKRCGCFNCEHIFHPAAITDWVPDGPGDTAICPFCGIDSILPDGVGFPVTAEYMRRMKEAYFY